MKLLIVDDEKYAIDGVMDGVAWEQLPLDKVLTANSATQAWDIWKKIKSILLSVILKCLMKVDWN